MGREAVQVDLAIELRRRLGSWRKVARAMKRTDGSRFTVEGVYRAVVNAGRLAEANMPPPKSCAEPTGDLLLDRLREERQLRALLLDSAP